MCTNCINTLGGNNLSQRGGAVKPLRSGAGLVNVAKFLFTGRPRVSAFRPSGEKRGKTRLTSACNASIIF